MISLIVFGRILGIFLTVSEQLIFVDVSMKRVLPNTVLKVRMIVDKVVNLQCHIHIFQ